MSKLLQRPAGRKRLADRRRHEIIEFRHGDFTYVAGVGYFDDNNSLAEIFLNSPKVGTTVSVNARDGAILASLLLQFGCPVETIRRAITRNSDGNAAGPIGRLLDLLAASNTAAS